MTSYHREKGAVGGIRTLFRPYQAALLEHIWRLNNPSRTGITSGQAHEFLQETGDPALMKSRASVIFFLNDMVEEGVLEYEEESGKGGYHRVYYPALNKEAFGRHVVEMLRAKLNDAFHSSSS